MKNFKRNYILALILPPLLLLGAAVAVCILTEIRGISLSVWAIVSVFYINFIRSRFARKMPKDIAYISPYEAEKYLKVLNFGKLSAIDRSVLAYYSGDLKKALEIAASALKGRLNDFKRLQLYGIILAINYQINDFDNMKQVFAKCREVLQRTGNTDAVRRQFPYLDFYERYLDGDIDGAINGYLEYYDSIPSRQQTEFDKYNRLLRLGVACYSKGDTEAAKGYMYELKNDCPNEYFRTVGKQYVLAIELSDPSYITGEGELLPSEEKIKAELANAKKQKIIKTGIITAVFTALAFVIVFSFINAPKSSGNSEAFEQMSSAAKEKLPSREPLGITVVEAEEGSKEVICVFKNPLGIVEVYSWCIYNDTNEEHFVLIAGGIIKDKGVNGESALYDYSYSFFLTDDSELAGGIGKVRLRLDGDDLYLYVLKYSAD